MFDVYLEDNFKYVLKQVHFSIPATTHKQLFQAIISM